ncbi:hypothetical protein PN483_16150, partial [Nodularia spumigena CS-591/04]|nr:hypothetical protein [Nodularia spumigena CS-591/04]
LRWGVGSGEWGVGSGEWGKKLSVSNFYDQFMSLAVAIIRGFPRNKSSPPPVGWASCPPSCGVGGRVGTPIPQENLNCFFYLSVPNLDFI